MDSAALFNTNDTDQFMLVNKNVCLYEQAAPWPMRTERRNSVNSFAYADNSLLDEEDPNGFVPLCAPPPSPQEPSLLDSMFAHQLSCSLEVVRSHRSRSGSGSSSPAETPHPTNNTLEHAQTLDRLLRRTLKEQRCGSISKRQSSWTPHKPRRTILGRSKSTRIESSCSTTQRPPRRTSEEWTAAALYQKLQGIAEAADKVEKLKRARPDNTESLVKELREMGL
ncbi:uncharacterized protein BYT42DRAFT_565071 [Radiomyces spectabilis]|uniref:uncharacterized protein n=1 Tax=Radiomyces spectabilis TaxID=64574 RepID=UPI00221FB434|nr:uncharacterized protein BYT42DRAFT_565071 [Radiomyces spectabilis]KAI8381050.1 hypothetical protein BYT42DRAFT_565071 [Radiomyces spectabilis]